LAEKLVPKSSHRKKEKPLRKKRRLPAGVKASKSSIGDFEAEIVEDLVFTSNADIKQERQRQRLVALTFCDLVSFDTRGKVNLMGCFDRIFVDKETSQTGLFYLYVRTAGARKGHVDVTFLSPKNKPIAQIGYDIDVKEADVPLDRPAHVQFHGRVGFGAKEKGVYWVDVTFNGESLGGRDLTIADKEDDKDERSS
jgi:hypothetical protein